MAKEERFFSDRRVYLGDIHNHCGISYGHGPLEDALYNASLQLDFAAVTGHAGWPDMTDEPMPTTVQSYHEDGFARLRDNWAGYRELVESTNEPGRFTTFFSYEFHSFRYGDRTVVTPYPPQTPDTPEDPDRLATFLRTFDARQEGALLLPHHIGYRTGYRGVEWDSVTDAASPLVEIYSMHGAAESDTQELFPYMHTMGPLNGAHTMQAGLAAGHHFGVTGSTDHHSAHPGSYGYGRTAVWAEACTRESIWQALLDRRTVALTGDRIEVRFTVDGAPLGSVVSRPAGPRHIEAHIRGGAALDRVELIKNNRVIHYLVFPQTGITPDTYRESRASHDPGPGLVYIEFGWGAKGEAVSWDIDLEVRHGEITDVEPRLRGIDVVDPLDTSDRPTRFSTWKRLALNTVHLETMTFGNPTTTTIQTQGIALELDARAETQLRIRVGSRWFTVGVVDLLDRSHTFYTGGFTSPAVRVHRFVSEEQRRARLSYTDRESHDVSPETAAAEDWYYLRVFQRNGHAAWTSPVWVSERTSDGV